MKRIVLIAATLSAATLAGSQTLAAQSLGAPVEATPGGPARPRPTVPPGPPGLCGGEGDARFICGVPNAEDLIRVPGTQWVLTSAFGGTGGIHIIDAGEKRPIQLYPAANATDRFDSNTYRACPGPPTAEEKARFTTGGINVTPAKNGVYTVFATRRGQPFHVFELRLGSAGPALTWVGCVPPPPNMLTNGIVPGPDGSIFVAKFYDTASTEAGRAAAEAGKVSGELWRWRPANGWDKVPGTESAGTNGVEVSADGKLAYINQWGSRSFLRVTLGANPPKRDVVQLPFRPDNVHRGVGGVMLVSGHTETGSVVATIDPVTLKVTQLMSREDTPSFAHSSGSVQVGDELWVGSPQSPRIAVFNLPTAR